MKGNIDILSMSATPIPRSLNMALSGIRSVSILSKAPSMRK
jgi:transcription-repair coupling factor (superfamily II helicase)